MTPSEVGNYVFFGLVIILMILGASAVIIFDKSRVKGKKLWVKKTKVTNQKHQLENNSNGAKRVKLF